MCTLCCTAVSTGSFFHEYSNSGVCIVFLHYKSARKGRMNYLAGLEEILVGLKPPKIDVVTPLLGQKKKKHRVIFFCSLSMTNKHFVPLVCINIHGFTWKAKESEKGLTYGFLHSINACVSFDYELLSEERLTQSASFTLFGMDGEGWWEIFSRRDGGRSTRML